MFVGEWKFRVYCSVFVDILFHRRIFFLLNLNFLWESTNPKSLSDWDFAFLLLVICCYLKVICSSHHCLLSWHILWVKCSYRMEKSQWWVSWALVRRVNCSTMDKITSIIKSCLELHCSYFSWSISTPLALSFPNKSRIKYQWIACYVCMSLDGSLYFFAFLLN